MPTCPQVSTLPNFCVGGQISPASCDIDETPDIRVVLNLVDSAGVPATGISDPNICTDLINVTTEEIHVNSGGCWCICIPFANYASVDPFNAITPNDTSWEIKIFIGNAFEGEWRLLGPASRIRIDADHDYDTTCGTCAPYGTACGECIPLSCLTSPTNTAPTTVDNAWCAAVEDCLGDPPTLSFDATTCLWTFTDGRGATSVFDMSDIVDGCLPTCDITAIAAGIDPGDGVGGGGGVVDTDTFGTLVDNGDSTYTWTPAGGGTSFTINGGGGGGTDTFVTFGSDVDGNITTLNADGSAGPVLCPAPCNDTFGTLSDNGDGTYTWLAADGVTTFDFGAAPIPCSVTAGGLTGTTTGAFTDGCTIETYTDPLAGPEATFPAAGFPTGWRQMFIAPDGQTESWIQIPDVNGVPQWDQQS